MKNLIITTLIFTLIISSAFGQETSEENKIRTYEISLIEYPQKIELVETENGRYYGNVITEITNGKWDEGWFSRFWTNLWNIQSKEIVDKDPIEESVVKNLMFDLKKNGIETVKDCNQDEDCNKLLFLDGGFVGFKVTTPNLKREYGFGEIYPLNEDNKEKMDLRFQAQKLITIIYEHIDLKQRFSDLFQRLPKGNYYYYQSSGNSIVTIKNKKRKK